MARFGMRYGNPLGTVEPSAITVDIAADNPADRVLAWTPSHSSGVVHHVMIDQEQFRVTAETSITGVPQDARDHIEIFETSVQNADEDLRNVASSTLDHAELTWDEVSGAARYEIYRKLTGGDYGDALAVITAGQASYRYVDGPLDDASYTYKLVVYDAAGNSAEDEQVVVVAAAPEAPSGLTATAT